MYTVTPVADATGLALAIATIPEGMEFVQVVPVDGQFFLITEPDEDDMAMPCCGCCRDNEETAAPESVYYSYNADDLTKNINSAIDAMKLAVKTFKR